MLLPPPTAEAGIFDHIAKQVKNVGSDVTQTQREAVKRIDLSKDKDEIKREATGAIESIKKKYEELLEEVALESKRLEEEKLRIEGEKNDLEDEKDQLITATDSLQFRERVFSSGFYASLGAIFIGVTALILRRPLVKLEIRLKELDIQEKEFAISRASPMGEQGDAGAR